MLIDYDIALVTVKATPLQKLSP